eukprot:gene25668-biopygen16515
MWGVFTRPRYRAGPCSWGPNPRHMGAAGCGVASWRMAWYVVGAVQFLTPLRARATVYGPALQVSGTYSWGPNPRHMVGPHPRGFPLNPLRARATVNGPALQVSGFVASWRIGAGPYNSPFRGSRTAPGSSPPGVGMAVRVSLRPWFGAVIAGAPTPDIWAVQGVRRLQAYGRGRIEGPFTRPRYRPLRARATVNGPALQVRGRTAGAPTPDIWGWVCGGRLRARPTGYAPALQACGCGYNGLGASLTGTVAFPHTPYRPALQVTRPRYRAGPYVASWRSSPTRGSGAIYWRRLLAYVRPSGLLYKMGLGERSRGDPDADLHGNYRIRPAGSGRLSRFGCRGRCNSPWGAHGLWGAGPYNSPLGGLTDRGVAYGPALQDSGARSVGYAPALQGGAVCGRRLLAYRGRIIRPGGLTYSAGSSPPGVWYTLSPKGPPLLWCQPTLNWCKCCVSCLLLHRVYCSLRVCSHCHPSWSSGHIREFQSERQSQALPL